jgi:hypothetical protein
MNRPLITLLVAVALGCAPPSACGGATSTPTAHDITGSLAINGFLQPGQDLDGGGSVGYASGTVSAGVTRRFNPAFSAGLSFRHDLQAWEFAGDPAAFGGSEPWTRLQRTSFGLNTSLALSTRLVIGLSPSVEWAHDSHAASSDGFAYGAVVSLVGVISPDFILGGGASIYRQLYSVKTSPFVIVNWKLSERWRIANAFPAGPEGGAGVELRYAITAMTEVAAGGVYRSDRYELGPSGSFAGGVGVVSGIPLFARLSRRIEPGMRIDVYGGAITQGKLELRDSDGHLLGSDRHHTAPAFVVTLSRRFG